MNYQPNKFCPRERRFGENEERWKTLYTYIFNDKLEDIFVMYELSFLF